MQSVGRIETWQQTSCAAGKRRVLVSFLLFVVYFSPLSVLSQHSGLGSAHDLLKMVVEFDCGCVAVAVAVAVASSVSRCRSDQLNVAMQGRV